MTLTPAQTITTNGDPMTDLATLHAQRTALAAEVERLRTAPMSADDPRLTVMWDEAMRVADDEGMCPVYDQIVGDLGGPTREREYDVCASITVTIHTHITVTASTPEGAIDAVEDIGEIEIADALLSGRYDYDRADITLDNIDGKEADAL